MIAVLRMRSGPGSSGLPLPFSGEVFLLGVAQRRRQLRISAVVGQEQDLRIRLTTGGRSWLVRRGPLPPMRPRLQPEDLRRDIAALRVSLNFSLFLAQVIDIVCTTGVGLSTQ